MIAEAIEALKKLQPPDNGASDKELVRWRWTVAVAIGVLSVSLATHIAIACGFLSMIHPGFARAGEEGQYAKTEEVQKVQATVEELSDALKQQRVGIIEASILDTRLKQCSAQMGEVKYLYTTSLQKLLIEYVNLTQRKYPLPDCASF